MKGKKIISVLAVAVLYLSMSMEILASAGKADNNDLFAVPASDFQKLIGEVLSVAQQHPEWSEEQTLKLMDEKTDLGQMAKSGIGDIWNSLTDSEKRLIIRYPFDALKVNQAKDVATSQTELKFGHNGLGDRSDAFRHGIWNAKMTVLVGKEKAELFATAHEDKDTTGMEADGYTKAEHKNMDLHNNAAGREIGINNVNAADDELANIIYENIYSESSSFIWLH